MTEGDPIKRGRGRPRKHPIKSPDEKGPRGRPRKDAWVVSAVDLLFEHKGFESLQAALASLVSEYPGMERARTMEFEELKKEVAFKKLVAKARIEIKRRLRRKHWIRPSTSRCMFSGFWLPSANDDCVSMGRKRAKRSSLGSSFVKSSNGLTSARRNERSPQKPKTEFPRFLVTSQNSRLRIAKESRMVRQGA